MTIPATFPMLPGQGWSIKKTPTFSTRVASHVSGREVRVPLYAHSLAQFELTFDGLDSGGEFAGLQYQSLQTLYGFYLSCQGQALSFLYVDPSDNAVTTQAIGTGDGVTTQFLITRTIGGYSEPVSWVTTLTGVTVSSGTPGAYSLIAPNILSFSSAPAVGAPIAGNVAYAFQCRFVDDSEEFEEFMSGLWQVTSLKFRQVR